MDPIAARAFMTGIHNGGTMRQEKLIRLTPAEVESLKSELSGKVGEYIKLEDEKKAADADFTERLNDLWDEIRGMQTRINEG